LGFRFFATLLFLLAPTGGLVFGQTNSGNKPGSLKTSQGTIIDTTTWKKLAVGTLSVREFDELPLLSLKIAPLGLIDPFNRMLTFSGEIRPVSSNIGYGLEASYILRNVFRNENNPLQIGNGVVLRPYLRIYYQTEGKRTFSFLDFAGFYKSVTMRYTDWLDFFPDSPTQGFSQLGTLDIKRISYGFMILAGTMEYSGKGKKRTSREYFGGIGLRNRELQYASPGPGFAGIDQQNLWPYHTTGWAPTVHVGIRLGFFGLPNF
jgi:hypothetical protein